MKPIAIDHWVRTADRAIGIVRHVGGDAAEVAIDADDRQLVTLPIAELRRIANPARKLPPIDGLPLTRPRCAYCNRGLRPVTSHEFRKGLIVWTLPRVVRRAFLRWDAYDGIFCRLSCARAFAVAAHAAGYRIRRDREVC